ncbi:hypothetical protein DL766_000612 [Monosporascus sp. MC13-8B]|uniref:Phosphotransferase n=1 Tax=Monosporascus cannonballus TaxID=155416 RepID=A0ABY0GT27_9PEZI|nr:hypothetical protein DL762_009543 [Monosporascus cannonballus]RYO78501.1 hypothetical protein DL763_009626 [Monosporascus cannonballus]RYP38972.1 hypothetical protein DL766_000612 [Monosporascus sp. MC13-8B]
MKNLESIPKLKTDLPPHTPIAINCEYGAFDNDHRILPRTKYDKAIDEESPKPGEQAFEKMSAGLYLGEIYRQIMCDFYDRGLVFALHMRHSGDLQDEGDQVRPRGGGWFSGEQAPNVQGTLGEVLDWPKDRESDPIVLTSAEYGSGVGAAVIAAMTMKKRNDNEVVGQRK